MLFTTETNNDVLILCGDLNEYSKQHSASFEVIHGDCVGSVRKKMVYTYSLFV